MNEYFTDPTRDNLVYSTTRPKTYNKQEKVDWRRSHGAALLITDGETSQ